MISSEEIRENMNRNYIEKNMVGFNYEKKRYMTAFLINLAIAGLAFGWSILANKGLFSLAGDFNSQQITFAMHANDMIKSGQIGFDYSIDLGSGFIGSMAFYILGVPTFWISMLFPSDAFMYVVGWLYVLKYAVAGLTSYIWFSRYVKDQRSALIGSMLYAFSGFMNENLLFYHFHDVVMLFPLLLITFDDLVEKNKRGPFIFALFVNAICNYYFLIGEIIFIVIYYVIKYLVPDFKANIKKVGRIIWEGALGCMLGFALLFPAFLFVIQNPRVTNDYTGSNALVFSQQRYLFILKAILFPGEVMSDHTAVIESNFSSCAAYLPMVCVVLVIAFGILYKKHWVTRLLKVSLLIALVPILNAAFSLFAGLYCRWYYMPILIMALASAMVIDRYINDCEPDSTCIAEYADIPDEISDKDYKKRPKLNQEVNRAILKGTLITLGFMIFFVAFLSLVKWNENDPSLIYRPVLFAVYAGASTAGIILTWFILNRAKDFNIRYLFLGVMFFSLVSTSGLVLSYQMEHGKYAGDIHDQIETSADLNNYPDYRYDSDNNLLTLSHGIATRANFCSTVQGSIFEVYDALDLERSVKSPDAPSGFNNLISAAYTIEYTERETGEEPVQELHGEKYNYYVYKNENVPAIGFTYDYYMTRTEFDSLPTDNKAIYMLKALVIPDDKEAEVSQYLNHYIKTEANSYGIGDIDSLSSAHLDEDSEYFERDSYHFRSVINADREKYAFFSIPNDSGWSAIVNGKEAEIIDINGFMAVKVDAGTNDIVFNYETPGLKVGVMGSAAAVVIIMVYLAVFTVRNRKAKKTKENA